MCFVVICIELELLNPFWFKVQGSKLVMRRFCLLSLIVICLVEKLVFYVVLCYFLCLNLNLSTFWFLVQGSKSEFLRTEKFYVELIHASLSKVAAGKENILEISKSVVSRNYDSNYDSS